MIPFGVLIPFVIPFGAWKAPHPAAAEASFGLERLNPQLPLGALDGRFGKAGRLGFFPDVVGRHGASGEPLAKPIGRFFTWPRSAAGPGERFVRRDDHRIGFEEQAGRSVQAGADAVGKAWPTRTTAIRSRVAISVSPTRSARTSALL